MGADGIPNKQEDDRKRAERENGGRREIGNGRAGARCRALGEGSFVAGSDRSEGLLRVRWDWARWVGAGLDRWKGPYGAWGGGRSRGRAAEDGVVSPKGGGAIGESEGTGIGNGPESDDNQDDGISDGWTSDWRTHPACELVSLQRWRGHSSASL